MNISPQIQLAPEQTQTLLTWVQNVQSTAADKFSIVQILARKLGAHYQADGLTQFGFWIPELISETVYLEIFTPTDSIDFRVANQVVNFQRQLLELPRQGDFVWGVVAGLKAGNKTQSGAFYWLRSGQKIIRDVLAQSLPYGVFAPAELYNFEELQQERTDLNYFQKNSTVKAPCNILQIHVGTASPEGTIEGLTRIYQNLSQKLATHQPLTAAEKNYVGFDAVELLPIEPTVEFRLADNPEQHTFWQVTSETNQTVQIKLKKPDTQNWGYDDLILGAATTSPAILSSLRPAEMVDFIAVLHNFSQGSIQIIFDLVYGHIHNQALQLINTQFYRGANMYGQDTDQQNPIVRAILLEAQRRKINFGADGVRIDGGQDFQQLDAFGNLAYDNDFLLAMGDVVQEIGNTKRKLLSIYEDGRPWPHKDWEYQATYRDLIELKSDCYQWSPLIFEHNTPVLQGFWLREWRHILEVMTKGDRWITGCASHDTVRKINQIDPNALRINDYLGEVLPEIAHNAYDNPATQLLIYGFSPGLPMDFLQSLMHTPWCFFRNTDDEYGVKIVTEEIGFFYWQITPEIYCQPWAFRRLKKIGFDDLRTIHAFLKTLQQAIENVGENLKKIVPFLKLELAEKYNNLAPRDRSQLKAIAMAFMEDSHEACRVSHYFDAVPKDRSEFNLKLRQYRHENIWLRENFTQGDRLHHFSDDKRTVFYGMRTNPQTGQRYGMVVHMAGKPITVTLGKWLHLDWHRWQLAIATPNLDKQNVQGLENIKLNNGDGFIITEIPP